MNNLRHGLIQLARVVAAFAAIAYLTACGVRDPTEGSVITSIRNDKGSDVLVTMCEDAHCDRTVPGGRLLKVGEYLQPRVQPFTSISMIVSVGDSSGKSCVELKIGQAPEKEYLISSLTPCAR